MKNFLFLLMLALLTSTGFAQAKRLPPLSVSEQLNRTYCSGLFSTDGTYFDLLNDNNSISAASYINILDWLQGRVAGLQIYSFYNKRVPYIRNSPASIYLDEMRIDAGFLNSLPVADIAMVKIIKTPFFGGWGGGGGAIAIYTKDGE